MTSEGRGGCRGLLLELDAADAQGDRREHEIQDAEAQDESDALTGRHGDGHSYLTGQVRSGVL